MLKEAIEKIVSLAENKTYEINGDTYSDNKLVRIEPYVPSPTPIRVASLESVVKLIEQEQPRFDGVIFVQVKEFNKVNVFTTYRDDFERNYLYEAATDLPEFRPGWMEYEGAMIALRSKFIQNEGTEYLLSLLSRITDENKVTSNDNGVSQTVEVRKGIAMVTNEKVKSRVSLKPYRTFLEVEQPESEFLLRVQEGGSIGLFEADGGMWKLTAKRYIREYLEKSIEEVGCADNVVVMA